MTQTEWKTRSGGFAARRSAAVGELPRSLGRWELVTLAAEGNWSQIYRARPLGSSPQRQAAYALKTLRPQAQQDPRAAALLAREARAGRSISHPHLIPVLEAGLGHAPPYLVMPWLEGTTLETGLAAGAAIDLPAALWIVRQVAEALGAGCRRLDARRREAEQHFSLAPRARDAPGPGVRAPPERKRQRGRSSA